MGATVVIIDDEPIVCTALLRQLRTLGISAVVADDALEAAEIINTEKPLMVICDKRMPHRSGVEVLIEPKRDHPTILRCLLTGSLSELTEEEAEAMAPCTFIGKPWSREQVDDLARQLGVPR